MSPPPPPLSPPVSPHPPSSPLFPTAFPTPSAPPPPSPPSPSPPPPPKLFTPHSLTLPSEPEFLRTDAKDAGPWQLSPLHEGSGGFWWSASSALPTSISPHLKDLSSASVRLCSSSSQWIPPSRQVHVPDMPCSAVESLSHGPIQEESLSKGGCWGTPTKVEDPASALALFLCEDNPDASSPVLKSLHPSSRMSPQEWTPESPSVTEEELIRHQRPSEQAWDSLRSHGNVSMVEEDKPCDTLQMSPSEGLTFLSKEVCKQETHTLVHRLHSFPSQDHLEESREAEQLDTNVSETPKTLFFYPTKDLIEVDSLDLVFDTSEPGVQRENLDAFFQDGGVEGLVYWAEPIQVSSPDFLLEESQSQEAGICGMEPLAPPPGRPTFSSSSSPPSAETDHPPANDAPPFLSSSRGFSLQMSSPLASHIVHRKDIPYETNPQCSRLPRVLRLDTSTPYRAVQSWADLQIQRNILTKMFMQGFFHTIPNRATVSKSVPERASSQRLAPRVLTGTTGNKRSVSEPGIRALRPDEEVHIISEGENLLWDQRLVNMTCSCACRRTGDSSNTQQAQGKSPVSSAVA